MSTYEEGVIAGLLTAQQMANEMMSEVRNKDIRPEQALANLSTDLLLARRDRESALAKKAVTLHMAETRQSNDGKWDWLCRCGEGGTGLTTQKEARKAGDAHLAEANA